MSMARGGIYTADLAAKEKRIKMGKKREVKERIKRKRKQSTALELHAVCRVHAPQREQGFACYWVEGSGVGLRHPLTLARASGTLGVSITVAALRPRPGEKPQKLPGEGKKLVKI